MFEQQICIDLFQKTRLCHACRMSSEGIKEKAVKEILKDTKRFEKHQLFVKTEQTVLELQQELLLEVLNLGLRETKERTSTSELESIFSLILICTEYFVTKVYTFIQIFTIKNVFYFQLQCLLYLVE